MTFLVACKLTGVVPSEHGITYRPDLNDASLDLLSRTIAEIRPRVLITNGPIPNDAALAWRRAVPSGPLLLITLEGRATVAPETSIISHTVISSDASIVLARAERLWSIRAVARVRSRADGTSVTLVGAGIVNVITAWNLARAGYQVNLIDAGPDPRSDAHWTEFGCTMGGANARMFTMTEADVYQEVGFDRLASAGGWRVRCEDPPLSAIERKWLRDAHTAPAWLEAPFARDTYRFNREAGRWWQRWQSSSPELFLSTDLRHGIVRVYSALESLRQDIARHQSLHLEITQLSPDRIAAEHPALAAACATPGLVAGGIEVPGFTLDVHAFLKALLDSLEADGACLKWRHTVEHIRTNAHGVVTGLSTATGLLESDHYVVSPGLPIGDLLRGTHSDGLIHGVLGMWLTLPNAGTPLTTSLKLHRSDHVAADANITVVGDKLVLGSGYGWIGNRPQSIDPQELSLIAKALQDTARRYFPSAYQALQVSEDDLVRHCVRPWTASSLGIFETRPTANGGVMVITGGHNTGGFAQAPAIAAAALAALRGRSHLMHALYHPQRMARVQ